MENAEKTCLEQQRNQEDKLNLIEFESKRYCDSNTVMKICIQPFREFIKREETIQCVKTEVYETKEEVRQLERHVNEFRFKKEQIELARIPFSLVPKLPSFCNSQPASVGDFYWDEDFDQYDQDNEVSQFLDYADLHGELINTGWEEKSGIKDLIDNVFLSMSISSTAPNSLESCESLVVSDEDVTLVSDDGDDID